MLLYPVLPDRARPAAVSISVFHDHQHGTDNIVEAALPLSVSRNMFSSFGLPTPGPLGFTSLGVTTPIVFIIDPSVSAMETYQVAAISGRTMRLSLTARTPEVVSAATRMAFFIVCESTKPHSSTVP